MFAHYADDHKGICIEYTLNEDFLKDKMFFHKKVEYNDEKDLKIKDIESVFALKVKDWEYEKEVRLVSFGKQEFFPLEKGNHISKIIFGLQTPEEDKDLIRQILEGKGVKFYRTKKGKSPFELVFEPVPPIPEGKDTAAKGEDKADKGKSS